MASSKKQKHITVIIGDVILVLLNVGVVIPALIAYAISLFPEIVPSLAILQYFFVPYLTVFYSIVPLICLLNIIILVLLFKRYTLKSMHKFYAFLAVIISVIPIYLTLLAFFERYS